ncbi:MAG TPA: glucose 1-dehydrogenase [Atribacteraceae bacterium]|nr:glucose 1-dehydrogenase [Atribacteraceae bacterium]
MHVKEMFSLTEHVAIVTGGAQGLGEEMAVGLAEAGAHVVVADKNPEKARLVSERLSTLGVESFAVTVDVTRKSDLEAMTQSVMDRFGQIDVLVTSAGVGQWCAAEEISEEDWKWVLDINLNGVFLSCQVVGREMIKRKQGSIVNIASMSGIAVNYPQCQSHYNASKSAVIMLTRSLALEWAKHNVRVNALAPGYMQTQLIEDLLKKLPDYAEAWKSYTPMRRLGRPEEIKAPCVFLASPASSYLTGSILVMDGGYTVW